ncbi:MAG: DUF4238 domain-containing protein [Armatimonadetes bacterium]|nr:DUF4238 domain-containing protein [Armatimonadota bacterium]
MQRPARRHHYLPECYLATFTASRRKDDFLYVFDLESEDGKAIKQRPRNVAFQKDYHRLDWPGLPTDFLEKSVFGRLESELAPIMQRVGHCEDVSREDVDSLLQLVALCAVRVPAMRDAARTLAEEATGSPFEEAVTKKDAWHPLLRWCAEKQIGWGEDELEYAIQHDDYREGLQQLWTFLDTIMNQDTMLHQLAKRNWSLWTPSEGDAHLICCDNPLYILHAPPAMPLRVPMFDEPGTVVTFPLSRTTVLIGTFDSEEVIAEVGAKAVANTNTGTMGSASRFLYSAHDDFVWLGHGGQLLDWAACFDLRQKCKRGERPPGIPPEYFHGV